MYDRILALDSCYGCGVCAAVCPVEIIELREDGDGFYRPVVTDPAACTECGLCDGSCAALDDGLPDATAPGVGALQKTASAAGTPRKMEPLSSFAARSASEEVRASCSSGGAAYELARSAVSRGAAFCGVRYDAPSRRAMHFTTHNETELESSKGSKYMQSYSADGFRDALAEKGSMIVGSPCQIASLRKYLDLCDRGVDERANTNRHGNGSATGGGDKDETGYGDGCANENKGERVGANENRDGRTTGSVTGNERADERVIGVATGDVTGSGGHLLVDFFCHGTPSMHLWRRYLDDHADTLGAADLVRFRDKTHGWADSWRIAGERGGEKVYLSERDDLFFTFYLCGYVNNEPCYRCPFRLTRSAADLRVGDMWGGGCADDPLGASAVLAMTPRGEEALRRTAGLELAVQPVSEVISHQLRGDRYIPGARRRLLRELTRPGSLAAIYSRNRLRIRVGRMLHKLRQKLWM